MHDPRHPLPARPADQVSQADQRHRRRASMRVAYGGGFDLAAELAAIAEPLERCVAAAALPASCNRAG
jgi:uncharacterized protein (DUF2344 family)